MESHDLQRQEMTRRLKEEEGEEPYLHIVAFPNAFLQTDNRILITFTHVLFSSLKH